MHPVFGSSPDNRFIGVNIAFPSGYELDCSLGRGLEGTAVPAEIQPDHRISNNISTDNVDFPLAVSISSQGGTLLWQFTGYIIRLTERAVRSRTATGWR